MSSSPDANKEADETVAPRESSRRPWRPELDPQPGHILNYTPISRIMRAALPGDTKVSREAIELMQECVSEFISFVTSEAENRSTLSADDVLTAMTNLGFEHYSEVLRIYLRRYYEKKDAGITSTIGPTNDRQQGTKRKSMTGANDNEDNSMGHFYIHLPDPRQGLQ
ncbi:hypothetical protein AYO20_08432 [Fonsecaea nubica]|uniref:Transcription factor CBF/NF-Y/archaeal histone domain-containing protein n=1 Tax=Fonsecaea nubica TaxID=856822 RepID=A0A178CQC2_9EURO|nr:hypothetical protein AYO20_08432 [Fonsecaea nubica]OAL31101.1 hypothetical protein AYO20_08432 [Fonsecaea nubica]